MAYRVEVCLDAVDAYIDGCFASEGTPRVAELAGMLGLGRETLSRRFAAQFGAPLGEYMKQRQLAFAQRLLASSPLSTQRIAYQAGFGTRRSFYRAFRRATGMSPADFRRRSQNVSTHPSTRDE